MFDFFLAFEEPLFEGTSMPLVLVCKAMQYILADLTACYSGYKCLESIFCNFGVAHSSIHTFGRARTGFE